MTCCLRKQTRLMSDALFTAAWIRQSLRLLRSYEHWIKSALIAPEGSEQDQAIRLFEAPFVLVSHGTEADPILNYGNRKALELWDTDLDAFLQMPSRLTAEPMEREERARMLERTETQGYIDDYRGVRISRSGTRFLIEQATVWNVLNEAGQPAGQAAMFRDWTELPQN